jgi:hypothetical protein
MEHKTRSFLFIWSVDVKVYRDILKKKVCEIKGLKYTVV